jgi:hypothetical protein
MISFDDIREAMRWFIDVVACGSAVAYVATKWEKAQHRRDSVGKRALSKAHHINGSVTLTLGIKAAALVYTGHRPGIRIGGGGTVST